VIQFPPISCQYAVPYSSAVRLNSWSLFPWSYLCEFRSSHTRDSAVCAICILQPYPQSRSGFSVHRYMWTPTCSFNLFTLKVPCS
jgi:hypothetical protein